MLAFSPYFFVFGCLAGAPWSSIHSSASLYFECSQNSTFVQFQEPFFCRTSCRRTVARKYYHAAKLAALRILTLFV